MTMAPIFAVLMVIQSILMGGAEAQASRIISNNYSKQYPAPNWAAQTIVDSDDAGGRIFNVEKYGGVGDGKHNSTEAFVRAWNAACKKPSATLLVPVGKKFLVDNLFFEGPCKPGFIFKVDGVIAALQNRTTEKDAKRLLQFAKLERFTLMGKGIIEGDEVKWWAEESRWINGQMRRLLPKPPVDKGGGPEHNMCDSC